MFLLKTQHFHLLGEKRSFKLCSDLAIFIWQDSPFEKAPFNTTDCHFNFSSIRQYFILCVEITVNLTLPVNYSCFFPLKSHYAFNKIQETKSPVSLLMGSQQSHLHIDVLLIKNFGCFAKFELVKKIHNNKSGLIYVYIHQGTPCMHCSLF